MQEDMHRARLVDPASLGDRSIVATLPRSDVEEARSSAERAPQLLLDVARRSGDDVEAHTLSVEFTAEDLDRLLDQSTDQVTIAFDREELERAFDDDVEAHGLRERVLVLAVAAATTGAFASQAAAHTEFGASNAPAAAASAQLVSDAASGGGYDAPAAASSQLVSDAASGGGYDAPAAASSQLVSDAASGGGYDAPAVASSSQLVSDAASGGGYEAPAAAAPSELVSDAASGGGYESPAAAATVSTPSASGIDSQDVRDAAIGGGIVLLITGAGFLIRGQRGGGEPRPA